MSSTLLVTRAAGALTITFNRPAALNAVDMAMSRDMRRFAETLPAERDARVIVLRGSGSAFMAGGDITGFADRLDAIEPFVGELIDGFHRFIQALSDAPQPVIASIHGAAAGGGLSLMLASDLTIAAADTKLAFAYSRLGTSPDGGCTYTLPRLVGAKRAAELLLLDEGLSAAEGLALGLVNRVVPADQLDTATAELANRLARSARQSTATVKALLRSSHGATLADQLAAERSGFISCATQPDFGEGVGAFLAKRTPRFS